MDKLAEDFKESLFNDSSEVLSEYIEIGIDSFINDGVLKNIPIVNTIVSVLKVGKNIHDRNLLKQTLTFIDEFNKNNISEEQLNNYKNEIENNSKRCEEELGRVLLLLNSYIDKEKSEMLAKLFKVYVSQEINWDEFCEYAEIINRIFIQDLQVLKGIYNGITVNDKGPNRFRIERLYNTGLVGWNPKVMFSFGEQEIRENRVVLNEIGKKFVKMVF